MSRPNKPLAQSSSAAGTTPGELPTVVFSTEGCVMAYWRNVLVAVWGVEASLPLLDELRKAMTRMASEHARMSVVHVSLGASPLPSKELRAGFIRLTDDFAPRVDQIAVLIGDSGFWASAVRSFITSLVLGRQPFKVNLCGSVGEVSRWLAQGQSIRSGQLVAPAPLQHALEWVLDRPQLHGLRKVV